jgi:hypothetical protein
MTCTTQSLLFNKVLMFNLFHMMAVAFWGFREIGRAS